MASPEQGDIVQQYSCRCRNVTINAYNTGATPSSKSKSDYQRVFVGEHGIHIYHHYLTLRMRDRAQESKSSLNRLVQHLSLCCLACKTLVYRIAQEIIPGSEAREGPVIPTDDWVEQETLRSRSGWIEVYVGSDGCLMGKDEIEQQSRSLHMSHTFSIGIISHSSTLSSESSIITLPFSDPWEGSPADDFAKVSTPTPILPPLPPLFPPPPFTPSHPVFLSLSACATEKSSHLRQQTEDEARSFVKSRLDALEKEEARLRNEVDGIWRGYREGWKEVLGRVNEERRRSSITKSEASIPTSSVKSGVPMSIRDFSPVIWSHPQLENPRRTPSLSSAPPSTSLLSASLVQTAVHVPASPLAAPKISGNATLSLISDGVLDSWTVRSHLNGERASGSSSLISPKAHSDGHFPGAFKRNMDTNVDIASSVAWVQGEEEMRRRFGGGENNEPGERARKRTSKNLGIGAVEATSSATKAATHNTLEGAPQGTCHPGETQSSIDAPTDEGLKDNVEARSSPARNTLQGVQAEVSDVGTAKRSKRRVTFDVQSEISIVPKATQAQGRKQVGEVELFDLDDLSSTEPFPESDLPRSKPARPQPVNRTPSYKLRPNDAVSAAGPSLPASLPVPRPMSPRSPVNGIPKWAGGPNRRSVGLADALPLLSSSVPAGDWVTSTDARRMPTHELTWSPRTPSPRLDHTPVSKMIPNTNGSRTPSPAPPSLSRTIVEPAEAELKNLLAASAPSHRHAWREGGKAWEMFHQRSRNKRKIKGTIAEEGSDSNSSSLEDNSDISSDDDLTHGPWRNPSLFASSLPVQIRPLVQYQSTLERKTSLTDKQGVLVPPLKVTNTRVDSAAAIRKAVYAERDRIRSIDPGPTLDFNEQEDNDENDVSERVNDGDRGRRHALSILQARSVIPEAGMWRSMAS
ncbi:hypothetical protein K439DRAFT_12233 [Ramaria rubella]|nr:hypothetical protein K439DRAFT_12233 [Ramaria rubella]